VLPLATVVSGINGENIPAATGLLGARTVDIPLPFGRADAEAREDLFPTSDELTDLVPTARDRPLCGNPSPDLAADAMH
jgi:hypothetical protein